jgi:HPt (histidine-containing phosphotransfer) domain-containing protein
VTDPLAPLRERFRARSAEDLVRLQALLEAADARELRRLVHGIAGAAGTFGFPALSKAAIVIDDAYVSGLTPDTEDFDRLKRELEAVALPKAPAEAP